MTTQQYYSITSNIALSITICLLMASTRKLNTKDGVPFYEISVSRGRGIPRLIIRWYSPAGWSQKAIDRELVKVAVEFERKVKAGEVITRQEERMENYRKALEAAQIKTLSNTVKRCLCLLWLSAVLRTHGQAIKAI